MRIRKINGRYVQADGDAYVASSDEALRLPIVAAAPELLEELRRAVAHVRANRKGDRYVDDSVSDWLGRAETLIAKAEGQ